VHGASVAFGVVVMHAQHWPLVQPLAGQTSLALFGFGPQGAGGHLKVAQVLGVVVGITVVVMQAQHWLLVQPPDGQT